MKAGDRHATPHAPRHRFVAWFPYPAFPEKGAPHACFSSSPSCRRTTISLSSLKLSSDWTHSFLLLKNTSLFSYPPEHSTFVPSLTFLLFLCLKWKTGSCFHNCNVPPHTLQPHHLVSTPTIGIYLILR